MKFKHFLPVTLGLIALLSFLFIGVAVFSQHKKGSGEVKTETNTTETNTTETKTPKSDSKAEKTNKTDKTAAKNQQKSQSMSAMQSPSKGQHSGQQITQGKFSRLELHGGGHIVIYPLNQDLPYATINPESAGVWNVVIKNDTLFLEPNWQNFLHFWHWFSPQAEVAVYAANINGIKINGAGSVETYGEYVLRSQNIQIIISGSGDIRLPITADSIDIAIHGSGDVYLQGQAQKIRAVIHGTGDIVAYELLAEDAEIIIHGAGDVKIRANHQLNVKIHGSGDVLYLGEPRLHHEIHGSGRVAELEL